jgi:hypothetical protein
MVQLLGGCRISLLFIRSWFELIRHRNLFTSYNLQVEGNAISDKLRSTEHFKECTMLKINRNNSAHVWIPEKTSFVFSIYETNNTQVTILIQDLEEENVLWQSTIHSKVQNFFRCV